MQRRGFPPKWQNWLSLLLALSSSVLKLNGTKGAWIKHRRG
jgi:hypothetical protein